MCVSECIENNCAFSKILWWGGSNNDDGLAGIGKAAIKRRHAEIIIRAFWMPYVRCSYLS